jgi:predicted esterase
MSLSDRDEDVQSSEKGIIRILCLHGKGNNGKSFQTILEPLEKDLGTRLASLNEINTVEFDYLTAPFDMDEDGDGKHLKMEWWTLPPGVRSFNAKEYGGFKQSSALVENALLEKDYDFIIGHSQGAILLSALLSCEDWKDRVYGSTKARPVRKQAMGHVFNGSAWPNPFTEQLERFSSNAKTSVENSATKPKNLFIIGERDNINPLEGAERVRDAFKKGGLEVTSCYHSGGHSLPVADSAVLGEIVDWIVKLVNQHQNKKLEQ